MYHRWPRRLGEIELCPIQPPGRENRIREPHFRSYDALCAALADDLAPFLDRPYAFFGHCGGALPAVELAGQLAAAGARVPTRLFVSSQVPPHKGPYGRFLDMSAAELSDVLRVQIRALGGTPTEEQVELGLDLLIADLDANRRYRRADPVALPCGVTVIGWTEDDEIPMAMMDDWAALHDDCDFALLEGAHYAFLSAPAALMSVFAERLGGA